MAHNPGRQGSCGALKTCAIKSVLRLNVMGLKGSRSWAKGAIQPPFTFWAKQPTILKGFTARVKSQPTTLSGLYSPAQLFGLHNPPKSRMRPRHACPRCARQDMGRGVRKTAPEHPTDQKLDACSIYCCMKKCSSNKKY